MTTNLVCSALMLIFFGIALSNQSDRITVIAMALGMFLSGLAWGMWYARTQLAPRPGDGWKPFGPPPNMTPRVRPAQFDSPRR